MRVLTTRCLTVILLWALCPGLTEAVENLWHLAASGHAAHAIDQGDDHRPEGDEHGCSGTFHLCSCHHSAPTILTPRPVGIDLPLHARGLAATGPPIESPVPVELFRPPRA
ncbi:MAG: hypothetical protein AAGC60_22035 [Acidobacteriota bacterium]